MFAFYDKLTPAQKLLLTALLSIIGASIVTAGVATWQLYSQQGQLNIGVLFGAALSTFCVLMSRELMAYVPAHVQLELNALRDSESQIREALARQQAITQSAINKNVVVATSAQPGPLVVIHTPQLTTSAAVVPAPPPPDDVSTLETARVPVPQISDMATQAVIEANTALTTMAQAVPAVNIATVEVPQVPFPDYSQFHWGDSQIVPTP